MMRRMLAAAAIPILAALAAASPVQAGDWGHYGPRYDAGAYPFHAYYPRVYVYPRVFYLPRAYALRYDARPYSYYPRTCCHPPHAYAAAFHRKGGSTHRAVKRPKAK